MNKSMQLAITVTYKTSILITWLHCPIKASKIDCQLVEQKKSSVVQDIKIISLALFILKSHMPDNM